MDQLRGRWEANETYIGDLEYANLGRYESEASDTSHDI